MPFAIGQWILFHHALRGGPVFIIAAILVVLLFRFWPVIVSRFEQWRR